ncbi:MAG: hypothetical protein MUC46_02740, partial [Desulfobacterales bacterium]|nr:hypothetical protein [Desulfobacterales bacterium]
MGAHAENDGFSARGRLRHGGDHRPEVGCGQKAGQSVQEVGQQTAAGPGVRRSANLHLAGLPGQGLGRHPAQVERF